ncbi:MAG: Gfo/Idh/MocA family oxidoreductase [Verrucomicrobiales bacterium]|nr:Gfo/Idh/MocA family oxidoreductase [Verrucomicrobiales bacterium]
MATVRARGERPDSDTGLVIVTIDMIRVGIIGYGKMGRTRAAAVAHSGLGRVDAIYDPQANGALEVPGVRWASCEQEILEDPHIDAVFICTPNHRNKPLTVAALNAGKHAFCEKPPAFNASEVEVIMAAERRSGRKLMYGFNHRHHGSIKTIQNLVESGQYGRLLWMRGRYGKSVDQDYFQTWRAKKDLAGGGILIDQGIHMLDLFLLLAGDFDEIQGMVSSLYWGIDGIEDNVFLNLRNRSTGVVASLHSTMTQWRHLFSLEVFLERGYMVLNGLKTQSGTYGDEVLTVARNRTTAPAATWEDEDRTTFHVDTSWNDETQAFLRCVAEDRPVETGSSTDALRVMRIIDAVYRGEHYALKASPSQGTR